MTNQSKPFNNKGEIIERLFFIILGNFLCSLAVNGFFIPSKLLSGGVGGIAIMIQYLIDIPTGISVFVINIPIFLIGARMVDKDFAIYGFISMFVYSTMLTLTNSVGDYIPVDDVILRAIFGGVLNGVGMGLMFRHRANQGGFDIIAAIMKRKYNVNIGSALMMINTLIIGAASILFGLSSAMYTLIAMYIGYQVLDKVQIGFNLKKNVIIVSGLSETIAKEIITKLNRGVTFLEGMGAYSKENMQVIYCIITSNEVIKVKNIVDKVDPTAFLIINDVVEVKGSGFKDMGI